MEIKYYPPETNWNISEYYRDTIKWYEKNYNSELVGWIYNPFPNYYTIELEDQKADVTPLMLFHREVSGSSIFSFEEESEYEYVKQPNGELKFTQINVQKFKDRCNEYPWIIMSEGKDDGRKGWMFKTKDLAKRWVYYLSITEFKMKDYYDFLELFKDNEGWVN